MVDPRTYNEQSAFAIFGYFSYGLFPANTMQDESIDNAFTIKINQLSLQRIIFYYIVPALLVITCSVLLIRRKRK